MSKQNKDKSGLVDDDSDGEMIYVDIKEIAQRRPRSATKTNGGLMQLVRQTPRHIQNKTAPKLKLNDLGEAFEMARSILQPVKEFHPYVHQLNEIEQRVRDRLHLLPRFHFNTPDVTITPPDASQPNAQPQVSVDHTDRVYFLGHEHNQTQRNPQPVVVNVTHNTITQCDSQTHTQAHTIPQRSTQPKSKNSNVGPAGTTPVGYVAVDVPLEEEDHPRGKLLNPGGSGGKPCVPSVGRKGKLEKTEDLLAKAFLFTHKGTGKTPALQNERAWSHVLASSKEGIRRKKYKCTTRYMEEKGCKYDRATGKIVMPKNLINDLKKEGLETFGKVCQHAVHHYSKNSNPTEAGESANSKRKNTPPTDAGEGKAPNPQQKKRKTGPQKPAIDVGEEAAARAKKMEEHAAGIQRQSRPGVGETGRGDYDPTGTEPMYPMWPLPAMTRERAEALDKEFRKEKTEKQGRPVRGNIPPPMVAPMPGTLPNVNVFNLLRQQMPNYGIISSGPDHVAYGYPLLPSTYRPQHPMYSALPVHLLRPRAPQSGKVPIARNS